MFHLLKTNMRDKSSLQDRLSVDDVSHGTITELVAHVTTFYDRNNCIYRVLPCSDLLYNFNNLSINIYFITTMCNKFKERKVKSGRLKTLNDYPLLINARSLKEKTNEIILHSSQCR